MKYKEFDMKKIIFFLMMTLTILLLFSCTSIYRVYNEEDLEDMAIFNYGFSEFLFFKIIDSDTSFYMTGTSYQNSGVIVGIKDNAYKILFVPKRLAEDEFFVMDEFIFNITEIYVELNMLRDNQGNKLYNDPSNDYGGLSISVIPYESIISSNNDITLDSELIFSFTTDTAIFYVGYSNQQIIVFDSSYNLIS